MIITSSANEKIKMLRKIVKEKDYLVLDNPKLIEEALSSGYKIEFLIVDEKKQEKYKQIEKLRTCANDIVYVSENVFNLFSNTNFSQGLVGIIKYEKREFKPPQGNYLVLDEIQDPGNVGTLIRSALGAGFSDIYFLNCVNLSNDKVIRSTMGGIFRTRIYELTRIEFIERFKEFKNKNLFIADMKGDNIFETKIEKPCGIVIGNEGKGVSKEIREIAKGSVSIPMTNELESLNASVAGSIMMFKIFNQK